VLHSESTVITSTRNPRIVEARKLAQRKHRERQARFWVEDLTILEMAAAGGAQPLEVFYCQSQLVDRQGQALLDRFRQTGAEVWPVSPQVMVALSQREAPEGMAATFALFEAELRELSLDRRSLVVVLDRLQDPGNLGTLIRTADAVGASAAILIEPCVDPFDPKTVRATMGSLFNVPVVCSLDAQGTFSYLREKRLSLVGTDPQRGKAWGEGILEGGVALVLGNETRGLSDDVRPFVEAWAHVPIVGRAESLNVAVAGSVLMYAWLRANL
jgi:TrmH family RNA methyltransferase